MINHVALFRFKDGVTEEGIAAFEEGLAKLIDEIDLVRGFRYGRDLGLVEGVWDYAVVVEFAEPEDYPAYREHPAHQEFITNLSRPLVAESVRVQFSVVLA